MERFADQQFESAFGGFQLVALILQFFDALQQFALGVGVELSPRPCCLQFVEDVAAAGEIAQEDALAVADCFGFDVFVGGGILEDGARRGCRLCGRRR